MKRCTNCGKGTNTTPLCDFCHTTFELIGARKMIEFLINSLNQAGKDGQKIHDEYVEILKSDVRQKKEKQP